MKVYNMGGRVDHPIPKLGTKTAKVIICGVRLWSPLLHDT